MTKDFAKDPHFVEHCLIMRADHHNGIIYLAALSQETGSYCCSCSFLSTSAIL